MIPQKHWPLLGGFLSAVLYVLSFPPFEIWILAFFSPLPLFIALNYTNASFKQSILGAWIFGFGIGLGGFSWVAYSSSNYGGLPYAVGVVLLLLFAATNQLTWPVYAAIRQKLLEKLPAHLKWIWVPVSGILFAGIENIIPKLFEDTYGNVMISSPQYRQLAEWGGPTVISAGLIIWAEACALAIQTFLPGRRSFDRIPHILTSACMVAWFSLYGWGERRRIEIDSAFKTAIEKGPVLKSVAIQANIGDALKVAAEGGAKGAVEKVVDTYSELSSQHPNADLIVWPETAYPQLFDHTRSRFEEELMARATRWKLNFNGTLALGGYDQSTDANGYTQDYNAFFFLKPGEMKPSERYHKSILLMFGETLPFADTFPAMKGMIPNMGFFGHGNGPTVITVPNRDKVDFLLSPSICYEGLFTSFGLGAAALNADAMLNITNDSWFGVTGEPELHLALTTFRAIETRTPMLRVTNTGITTLLSPTGEWLDATSTMTLATPSYTIPKRIEVSRPGLAALPVWLLLSRIVFFASLISCLWFWRKRST